MPGCRTTKGGGDEFEAHPRSHAPAHQGGAFKGRGREPAAAAAPGEAAASGLDAWPSCRRTAGAGAARSRQDRCAGDGKPRPGVDARIVHRHRGQGRGARRCDRRHLPRRAVRDNAHSADRPARARRGRLIIHFRPATAPGSNLYLRAVELVSIIAIRSSFGEIDMKALITGFEPFDSDRVNPSLEVLRLLPPRLGVLDIATASLPVVFGAALPALREAIGAAAPDLVLSVGLAGGRAQLSLERVAINIDGARIPDNDGNRPIDRPVVAGGPAAYFATLPIKGAVAALREAGLPAAVSNTAGTFVCNHEIGRASCRERV